MVGVEQQQEVVVFDRVTVTVTPLYSCSRKIHSQAAREMLVPFRLRHLMTVGREPDDLLQAFGGHGVSLQKTAATEHRVTAPKRNHLPGEFQKPLLFLIQAPVQPEGLVVLAVRIIVTLPACD